MIHCSLSHSNAWKKYSSHDKGTFHVQKGALHLQSYSGYFKHLETLSRLQPLANSNLIFLLASQTAPDPSVLQVLFPVLSWGMPPAEAPALSPDAQNLGGSRCLPSFGAGQELPCL